MQGRDSKRNHGGNYNNYGYYNGNNNRGGQTRNHIIPNEPPYTAYIGNAPDTMVQGDFEHQLFIGLKVKQVRLVRDRQTDRFRGFAYVDFEDADSLRSAIALDGTCVNDRPIRIDVASRPLGATKSEGFRNKPNFESRNVPRQLSGNNNNNNNNRSTGGFRQGGRDGNQQGVTQMIDGYYQNGYDDDYYKKNNSVDQTNSRQNSEQESQIQKEQTSPSLRKVSDDVFITPDTPVSNDDENHEHINNKDDTTAMIRQKSRNWADCPIDDSVVDTSPPPSINNTLTGDDIDDFQIVRNKTPKTRTNQHGSSRSMGNQSMRGRNNGNYSDGLPSSQTLGGGGGRRNYHDQMSSSYSNQSQQSYHHHNPQIPSNPLHIGLSYNNNNNNRHQPSTGSRQRLNSNRSNNNNNQNSKDDQSIGNGKRLTSTTSSSSYEINTVSTENRPKLQLLPRSQKLSSSTDDNQPIESPTRNSNIFGCGKPRDERDPKLAEFNKHIEEVVEKEQHLPRTKSTTSNESTIDVTKPIRILTAKSESSIEH